MGVETGDNTIVHDEDAVAVLHAEDALGDDELCHLGQLGAEPFPYLGIGGGVTGGRGVVEDEDFGMFQQGTGDAEALLLTTADIGATLFDTGVVALGHLLDELVNLCYLAGTTALVQRGVGVAPAEVVEDGAAEQDVLLQDDGDGGAQCGEVVVTHVTTTDEDGALGGVVETADEVDEGGLATAGAADDSDGLTAVDGEGDVI